MSVYLLATLDTKGEEANLVRNRLIEIGHEVTLVDVGAIGEPAIDCDISRSEIFAAAGTSLASIQQQQERGIAVTAAAEGAATIIEAAFEAQRLTAVISIGGSAGTTIGTTAMRRLPIGVPKVMLSTLASGQVSA